MKKNKNKEILIFLSLVIISVLELVKYKIFNVSFSLLMFIIKEVVIFSLFLLNTKLKKYKFLNIYINTLLLIISILALAFNSFNTLGLLFIFFFLLLITLTTMVIKNFNFETSLVISVSLFVLLFVLLGILNLLKVSYIFIVLITIISILFLYRDKTKTINTIKSINKKTIIIFSVLFLIAILSGVGRYVHKWDEYSYWAYAAKVTIDTSSIKSLVSYTGSMSNYPPVSSIWHYFISLFTGYSEPNLYIGLIILDFIYLMPIFMKINKKSIFTIIVFTIVSITFPYLFNGSITYDLLYVDLLLGFMCSSAIILHDYLRENGKTSKPIMLILLVITLLKPQGFIYSCTILFLFFLQELFEEKLTIKIIIKKVKKYILPVILVMLTFIIWQILSKIFEDGIHSYLVSLKPDSLKTEISQKLNLTFILGYINSLKNSLDKSIFYSFIEIPYFAFLILIFGLIYIINKKENKGNMIKILSPYLLSYIVFFFLTALSLFVMFSYYEASTLASFARYLAPINIALIAYVLYKVSANYEDKFFIKAIYLVIIAFIGFSNITFFITDVKERRETSHIKDAREEKFSIINDLTLEDSKVFVINQTDEDGIMPLWYARYYTYPRIVNSNSNAITWKIKTTSNEWDLLDWGLTETTFKQHLLKENFDYVFLYTKTDELFEELNETFDYNMKDYNLFKVEIEEYNIKLIPVK